MLAGVCVYVCVPVCVCVLASARACVCVCVLARECVCICPSVRAPIKCVQMARMVGKLFRIIFSTCVKVSPNGEKLN